MALFNKLKKNQESYFATNKNKNSWIINDKSPTKVNTATSHKGNHLALQMKYQSLTTPS